MIQLHEHALQAVIAGFFWPFVRILAFITSAPILSGPAVPQRVKIGLAALLAFLVAPTLPGEALIGLDSPQGLATLIAQIILGLAMGMTINVVFAAVQFSGEIAGMQMGLNFAGFFDPQTQSEGTPVGSWLGVVVTLAFLSINGHLMMIDAIGESFRVFPIGAQILPGSEWQRLSLAAGQMFSIGVHAALPIIAAMLICNLGIGVLARIAPQLNVLSISFSVTLLVGILILLAALPFTVQYLNGTLVWAVRLVAP